MRDWDQFLAQNPGFLQPGDVAAVGEEQAWSRGGVAGLPRLSALLAAATLTPVSIGATAYELLAWGPPAARRGWLCHPPITADTDHVHRIHQGVWSVCGGIVQRFGEREAETWWLNQAEILTAAASRTAISDILAAYAWIWEDKGLCIPIQPDDFYAVALEANGNLTLVHQETGELVLFAPDHAFDRVTPMPACPEYSLLTLDDVPDLETWIELSVSEQF